MASKGWFDSTGLPLGWFDETAQKGGWFDELTLDPPAGGGKVDYVLTCSAGGYALSGVATSLKVVHSLTCTTGSYAYTGVATTSLKVVHSLVCSAGAYAYTGVAASLKVEHSLVCAAGSYSYTGVAASLKVEHSLTCDVGAYGYTGNGATLTYTPGITGITYVLTCDAGAYEITGNDAELNYAQGSSSEEYSGGYFTYPSEHRKRVLDLEKKLKVVAPAVVAAAIDAVAEVVAERKLPNQEVDTAKAEKELRAFLKSQEIRWKKEYAQLVQLEYERREQEIEDAQIAMLLFEM